MKKIFTLLFLLVVGTSLQAQVGVGTDLPNASSQLDVVASDKGVLLPQVALQSSTDATTITNGNVFSLLVFNTNNVPNDITPGYHYWDGAKWQRVASSDDVLSLIDTFETLTVISQDVAAGTISYQDEDGNTTVLDLAAMIGANETLTSLSYDNAGSLTYLDEDGNATVIDLAAIIDSLESVTSMVDNGDGTLTYTDEDGVATTINLATIISNYETVTTLVDNGDGTYTYTSEDGTAATIDTNNPNIMDNGNGTYTVTNGDGTTSTIDTSAASNPLDTPLDIDGTIVNNVQEAVEALNAAAANAASTLVDNGDGTYTHTSGDGTVVVIDANNTDIVDNGDGTYTITNGDGTTSTIDTSASSNPLDTPLNIDGTIVNNVQEAVEALNAAAANAASTLVDNGDGTYTHTSGDGTATTFDAKIATVVDNTDGTYTITDDFGTSVTIDTNDVVTTLVDNGNGSFTYTSEDGTVTTFTETLSALVDNGNGTFTYTDEDGTATTFDAKIATVVDNTDGTYTITDDFGTSVTIDTNDVVTTLVDNGNGSLTYTDETGTATIIDLATNIDNYETVTSITVQPAAGTITYVDEDGKSNVLSLVTLVQTHQATTNLTQTVGTGVITYVNELGVNQTANVVSTDANNVVVAGTDGGAFVDSSAFDATDDAWVNNNANTRIELGTQSDGTTARPAGTEFVALDNGNVGIGTASPSSLLHVRAETGDAQLILESEPNNTSGGLGEFDNPFISFSQDGGTFRSQIGMAGNTGEVFNKTIPGVFNNSLVLNAENNANSGRIHLATEDVVRLTVRNNGNVGIGTTTPNEKLEVNGKVRVSDLTGADAATDVIVTADATTGELKEGGTLSSISTTTAIRTETVAYNIDAEDGTILVDASAGAVTVTLPTPTTGKKLVVKKIDTTVNNVVINGAGANIDGAATRTTSVPYQTFVLQSDGTNWFIIN